LTQIAFHDVAAGIWPLSNMRTDERARHIIHHMKTLMN
jgi:hypothetical protein